MASVSDWKVPSSAWPKPGDYAFDLDAALSAVVGVRAVIPPDAFTADTLGTERAGNGVLIGADGLVLTIGYLVTEADTIWLTLIDGRKVPGTVLAYDQGEPDRVGLGDEIADRQHQPVGADQNAIAGALGAERVRGEGVGRNDGAHTDHGRERGVEIERIISWFRPGRRRHFPVSDRGHSAAPCLRAQPAISTPNNKETRASVQMHAVAMQHPGTNRASHSICKQI